MRGRLAVAVLAVGLVGALGASQAPTLASLPVSGPETAGPAIVVNTLAAKAKKFKNCAALNKAYPHGVGKTKAKDKTSGRSKPVTNFKKNNALYQANKHLDRDKDGVACEKR